VIGVVQSSINLFGILSKMRNTFRLDDEEKRAKRRDHEASLAVKIAIYEVQCGTHTGNISTEMQLQPWYTLKVLQVT
jgi:hypothetical protein